DKAAGGKRNFAEDTAKTVKNEAEKILAQIKKLVKEGNVTFIRIKKGDMTVLNLPMTVGVAGTAISMVLAPWAIIIGTITTLGLSCQVEVEKKDGEIVVIHKGK
nr:DUF4342 domain-containing protein [Lachnospiraceae bacterium]